MTLNRFIDSFRARLPRINKLLVAAFAVVLVRTAWMCDDAYITLRTVDNFVNGRGLVYNIGERVQSYTHPLWMFLVTSVYAVTREEYFTPLFLSMILSLAAVAFLVFKTAKSHVAALFGIAAVILSRSFVDYSTSGLENPLSHLIVLVALTYYLRMAASPRSLLILTLCAAVAALNRPDVVLVFVPALLLTLIETGAFQAGQRSKAARALILGFAPLGAWLLFSLFYYGFPFPNAAYAKLSTGIPRLLLYRQGVGYFMSSFGFDPLTLTVIAAGIVVAAVSRIRRHLAGAAGAGLYLIYIVLVGGDFMAGRFFTVPFLCAVVLLCTSDLFRNSKFSFLSVAVVLVIGLTSPHPPVFGDGERDRPKGMGHDARGVADERMYYYPTTGLLRASRQTPFPSHRYANAGRGARGDGRRVIITESVGMFGFYAGAQKYVADEFGLVDPLLSRLPIPDSIHWRVGHYRRAVPAGYEKTLVSGTNRIADPAIAGLYDNLTLITRGRLLSGDRIKAIWKVNTGRYAAPHDESAR